MLEGNSTSRNRGQTFLRKGSRSKRSSGSNTCTGGTDGECKIGGLVFKSNGLGTTTAEELNQKLGATFIGLIAESENLPRAICFYTDGVKLACEGSPLLDPLKALEARGVRLILCTTCLNYFGLMDQVRVGIPGEWGTSWRPCGPQTVC